RAQKNFAALSSFWGAQAARLPACSRRQLADDIKDVPNISMWRVRGAFRQAAEKNRLAACAPPKTIASTGRGGGVSVSVRLRYKLLQLKRARAPSTSFQ